MKANAPEKLYISSKQRPDKEIFYGTCTKVESNEIEYTRTDAFVEKACNYLMEYEFNDSPTIADRRKRVEYFKKYMRR